MNSSAFYFTDAEPWDWTAPQNDALWHDGMKTLFDPCPAGWRAPKSGEGNLNPWNYFTTENRTYNMGVNGGRKWDISAVCSGTNAWYPCAGVRSSGNIFPAVGNTGYYWSGSILGTRGSRLRFDSNSVVSGVGSSDVRSDGYPVRCVRE